eukprot:4129989-Pleurochrysis_carterae.AAC.1
MLASPALASDFALFMRSDESRFTFSDSTRTPFTAALSAHSSRSNCFVTPRPTALSSDHRCISPLHALVRTSASAPP